MFSVCKKNLLFIENWQKQVSFSVKSLTLNPPLDGSTFRGKFEARACQFLVWRLATVKPLIHPLISHRKNAEKGQIFAHITSKFSQFYPHKVVILQNFVKSLQNGKIPPWVGVWNVKIELLWEGSLGGGRVRLPASVCVKRARSPRKNGVPRRKRRARIWNSSRSSGCRRRRSMREQLSFELRLSSNSVAMLSVWPWRLP